MRRQDVFQIIGVLVLVAVLLLFAVWRYQARLDICTNASYAWWQCVFIAGGK